MFIPRILNLKKSTKNKSLFLLGPRQTGKTSLIRAQLKSEYKINLLINEDFWRYQKDTALLRREFINKRAQLVIIDEIQRLPELLNEVHYLIEEVGHRFLLTGSSARKLRKSGVNLLGGRASQIILHPLTYFELKSKFDLEKALSFGLLPSVYFSENPQSELRDYVGLYLKEEILSEGLARNLPAFTRFLEAAASMNGKMINYTKMGSDAQIAPSTTYEYFKVLEDTLIAKEVLSFEKSKIRKAISTSKFYFFDLGVVRAILDKAEIKKTDSDYGDYFEAFIFHELWSFSSYHKLADIKYWRSKSNYEVDFILDNRVAIEVKSTKRVVESDLKGLRAFAEEKLMEKYFLISFDKIEQNWHGVECLHWESFLLKLNSLKI
jgi:predicted AAA+ superfamily ATPase